MLATVDLVRVGACVAVSLLLCTLRLRIILWADAIYSIVAGSFMIYYGKETLQEAYQPSGKPAVDIQHEFLLYTRIILQLMPALTWISCRNSVDITCRTAITLSRLVGYAGSAIVMAIEHTRTGSFTDFHLMYCLLPCCLWSVVMGVQLVRTGSRVNIHIRLVDINKFLRVDLFLLLLSCMADLVAPAFIGQLVGRQVDVLHAYLHRINGCVYLGLANIPWIGQRYRYSEDKHTILMARVLTMVGVTTVLPLTIYHSIIQALETDTCRAGLEQHSQRYSLLIWFGGIGYGIWSRMVPLALSTYIFVGQMALQFLPAMIAIIICQNGPFTAAFWSSQRKAVSINQQNQTQRRA